MDACVSRYTGQSGAKPSGPTENLFLPNVFKKFPARIHDDTFGRNGPIVEKSKIVRLWHVGGPLKYEKNFQGRSEGVWQGCGVGSSESWSMAKLWRRVFFFSQWMSSGLLIWRPGCKSLQQKNFETHWDATSPLPTQLKSHVLRPRRVYERL